jgi:hypothetical protein
VKDRTKRVLKGGMKELLVVLAIIAAFFAVVWGLTFLRHNSCDRLDAERISHLEPGHDTPGPGSIYVKGIGTDRSELMEYYEAEAAMDRAGCTGG